MILKLLTLSTLIFSTQLYAGMVSPSPQPIETVQKASLDAKLFELDGKWVVLLSNNTVLVFHEEEQLRLQEFLKAFGKDIPPYFLTETPELFNPYKLVFEGTEESFTLMTPLGAKDLWVLGYGDHKLYRLASTDSLSITLRSVEEDMPLSIWEFNSEKQDWNVGDFIVVVNIIAYSQHATKMAGYLAFRFESEADALAWQSSNSGYWIFPLSD